MIAIPDKLSVSRLAARMRATLFAFWFLVLAFASVTTVLGAKNETDSNIIGKILNLLNVGLVTHVNVSISVC